MLGRVGGCMPVINLNSFCVKWRREEKHCKMSEKAQQTKQGGFLTRPSPHQKSRALPSIPRKSHGHSAFWKGQDSTSADRDALRVSRGAWRKGPARDAPSAPLEKAGTRRARRLHSFAGSRAGPRGTASPPFPPANLFPSRDPSDRRLGPHPDSRGLELGPEPASSEVHSTCLPAAGLPRDDVCLRPPRSGLRASAPPPRPCTLPFRRGRSSAPGLHWRRHLPRGAGSSCLRQANRGAVGPQPCAHRGSQGADGRVPEARAGVPARAAKENWVSARRKRAASPREPGEATVPPGNFTGGLRSEGRQEQLVLSPLPLAGSRQF